MAAVGRPSAPAARVARVAAVSTPPKPERGPLLVLCGPMGSGKTSVGRVLAQRWGVELRDTDEDIVASTGMTIGDIFTVHGEPHFRQLEHEAVALALDEHEGILALGGGGVMHEETQVDLAAYIERGGTIVFLDVSIEFAGPRCGLDNSRPLLVGDSWQRWVEIMAVRRSTYERVSSMRILTDGVTPKEAARELERRIKVAARQPVVPRGAHHPE
ncbi:MAG: shikimate kinase [Cellulomonadaceae bacterium]|nr:shikimate kinase [Cellulomonadaceae bacterium]